MNTSKERPTASKRHKTKRLLVPSWNVIKGIHDLTDPCSSHGLLRLQAQRFTQKVQVALLRCSRRLTGRLDPALAVLHGVQQHPAAEPSRAPQKLATPLKLTHSASGLAQFPYHFCYLALFHDSDEFTTHFLYAGCPSELYASDKTGDELHAALTEDPLDLLLCSSVSWAFDDGICNLS